MNTRFAEEGIFTKKAYPLLYLVKGNENINNRRILQSRTGFFYVLVIIVIFFCMVVLLNIGLKIQTVNYERKILEIDKMLLLEKERADRLDLRISELKSPARIVETAQKDLKMEISPSVKVMKVPGSVIASEEKINDYVVKNTVSDVKKYDTVLSIIYSIKDIVMVVSEGVLTFFIP